MRALLRSPLILLLGIAVLTAQDCTEGAIDQQVSAEIKDSTGIDPNDPTTVAVGAFGSATASFFGATDEAKELDDSTAVLAGYRRADNEQQGDRAYDSGNYNSAVGYYQTALSWTPDTDKYAPQRVDLDIRLGNAQSGLADQSIGADAQAAQAHYKAAGDAYTAGAALRTASEPSIAAANYYGAGMSYVKGGYTSDGCAAFKKALAITPNDSLSSDGFAKYCAK